MKNLNGFVEKCANCYFEIEGNQGQSMCRRYPPGAHLMMVQGETAISAHRPAFLSQFPVIPDKVSGWCGEWKEKKKYFEQ